MRGILTVIVLSIVFFSCKKQEEFDVVPNIRFVDFLNPHKSAFTGSDTATMVLSFEDGDGDLFVDNYSEGPNLVFTTQYYNKNSQSYDSEEFSNATTVKQPGDGSYKGRSIRGEIRVPMTSFRSDNSRKILRFEGFMVDLAGNKSNVFTSPTYTLTF